MKVVGLITEYNPFHNGHAYHLKKAKELTKSDYVVVVMSGNYVQRGTPAILDKYTRTEMALANGADLVIELPVLYATSSAEGFASGAIRLLHDLGIITSICFGSEHGDIKLLAEIATALQLEGQSFKEKLKEGLKNGLTFPVARKEALLHSSTFSFACEEIERELSSSNNILGIEYIKSLQQLHSSIKPYTIKREGCTYNDTSLRAMFSSASAIRSSLLNTTDPNNASMETIQKNMPETSYALLKNAFALSAPIQEDDFSDVLLYALYTIPDAKKNQILDMNEDLSNRLRTILLEKHTFSTIAMALKSKQNTLTRINRTLLHILLQISTTMYQTHNPLTTHSYARILGFRKESSPLIKQIRLHGTIPIITKVANAKKILTEEQYELFQLDLFATHLYNQIVATKFNYSIKNEYKQGPIQY